MGPWGDKIKNLNSLPAIYLHTPYPHFAILSLAYLSPLLYESYVSHGSYLLLINESNISPQISFSLIYLDKLQIFRVFGLLI